MLRGMPFYRGLVFGLRGLGLPEALAGSSERVVSIRHRWLLLYHDIGSSLAARLQSPFSRSASARL